MTASIMEYLGYAGYAVLVFFAVAWIAGVRMKPDLSLHTALGSLFFSSAAVLLWCLEINKLYAWLALPLGFAFSALCLFILAARVPVLSDLVKVIGSLYASIIRLGAPQEKIRRAQALSNKEAIEKWAPKKGNPASENRQGD